MNGIMENERDKQYFERLKESRNHTLRLEKLVKAGLFVGLIAAVPIATGLSLYNIGKQRDALIAQRYAPQITETNDTRSVEYQVK